MDALAPRLHPSRTAAFLSCTLPPDYSVQKGIKNLANVQVTAAELFAIAETSARAGHDDEHLDRAYLNIIDSMNEGVTLDHKLVKDTLKKELKLRDRARVRRGSSPVALRTSTSSPVGRPCEGCAKCPLHCVDPKTSKCRSAPSRVLSRNERRVYVARRGVRCIP